MFLERTDRQLTLGPLGDPSHCGAGCGDGGQTGHTVLVGGPADVRPVGSRATAPGGVDHQAHFVRAQQLDGVHTLGLTHLGDHGAHRHAFGFQEGRGSRSGRDGETQLHETAGHDDAGLFVAVGQRPKHGARRGQLVTRRGLAFGEGHPEGRIDAHDFAGGTHLGTEEGVGVGETGERQHRFFDAHVTAGPGRVGQAFGP